MNYQDGPLALGTNGGVKLVMTPSLTEISGHLLVGSFYSTGEIITEGGIRPGVKTVGTLPAATPQLYRSYIVTDANAPTLGATVAAGGSAKAAVRSNGTVWKVVEIL
jgi:hypothetical protein